MRIATLAMSDLERAITGYFPQIYAGVYQGYRVILRAMLTRLYIEALLVDEVRTCRYVSRLDCAAIGSTR